MFRGMDGKVSTGVCKSSLPKLMSWWLKPLSRCQLNLSNLFVMRYQGIFMFPSSIVLFHLIKRSTRLINFWQKWLCELTKNDARIIIASKRPLGTRPPWKISLDTPKSSIVLPAAKTLTIRCVKRSLLVFTWDDRKWKFFQSK